VMKNPRRTIAVSESLPESRQCATPMSLIPKERMTLMDLPKKPLMHG